MHPLSPLFVRGDDRSIDSSPVCLRVHQLVNALYNLPMPKFNHKPVIRAQKLDNIALALKMVDDAKIKTNFLVGTCFD